MHDAASECLVNALYLVDDFVKHEKLALRLQSGIYETVTAFKSAIDKEDMEKYAILNIVSLLSTYQY